MSVTADNNHQPPIPDLLAHGLAGRLGRDSLS
jgi:hypothetical protein